MIKWIRQKFQKKVKDTVSLLTSNHEGNALDCAREQSRKYGNLITIFSIVGPLTLSALTAVFPWTTDWKASNNYVIISLTLILIVVLCCFLWKSNCYSRAVSYIQHSKEHLTLENEALRKKNKTLRDNSNYYITTAKLIGDEIQTGKIDIERLAQIVLSTFHLKLLPMLNGDNVTLNLYQVKDQTIKMLTSLVQSKHVKREEDIEDNPLIYMKDGIGIQDGQIKEYYCVKCISINDRKRWFILEDWINIAKEFKWDGWGDEENKQRIIREKDRVECLRLGFNYNQYLGIKFKHKEITWFLEIITNKDTEFIGSINNIANEIMDSYCPMIDVIWQIVPN